MKPTIQQKRLGNLFTFKNGRAFKKEEWVDNGIPIIRIQNLNSPSAQFNHFSGEYSKDIFVEAGDLLFSWSGTVGSSFGSHIWQGKSGVLNQHIFKVGLNDSIIKRYAFYGLRHITEAIERSVSGAVGLVHITKEKLNEFTLPAPELPEQQRIVAILDQAFEGIAKARANVEQNLINARALFEGHLQSVFTKSGEEWQQVRLKDIAEYFNGLTYSPDNVKNSGTIVLRSSNVQSDELSFNDIVRVNSKVKAKLYVQDGDILMCSRNGSKRLVGKTATISNLKEEMTFGTFMMIIRSKYNAYLAWFFKTDLFRKQISSGENTMINQITRYMLDDITLALPPSNLINEIVSNLIEYHVQIKKLEFVYQRKIALLDELKKSLLQQAFAGEL